jgi:hypothetical protein
MRKLLTLALLVSTVTGYGAEEKKPVYVLMYTRFDDHISQAINEERISRLLPLIEKLKRDNPESGLSAVFQFNGAVAAAMMEQESGRHAMAKVLEAVKAGAIEIGYGGEHEPTYRNRPKPDLKNARTPEERWTAIAGATRGFLNAFRHPYTGDPDEARSGGLRRVQEIFGESALINGVAPKLGGDAPIIHEIRRLNTKAIMFGVPDPDPVRAMHGYRISAMGFGARISPHPDTSPELYFESNVLRSSDTSTADLRVMSTAEGAEALQKVFDAMDRSKTRVLHLELGNHSRYLSTWHDGIARFHPVVWAWDHPDDPHMPAGIPAFTSRIDVEAAYQKEEAALGWLLKDFLASNKGSRFVSAADLRAMTSSPVGGTVGAKALREAAVSLLEGYNEAGTFPANFSRSGDTFYSLADTFTLLANAWAGWRRTGSFPESIRLPHVYGPIGLIEDFGPAEGSVSTEQIAAAAAELAGALNDESWTPVPRNAVPNRVRVGELSLMPAQFLRLMAEAYLEPAAGARYNVRPCGPFSPLGEIYPRGIAREDQGNVWTFRPAVIRVQAGSNGKARKTAAISGSGRR